MNRYVFRFAKQGYMRFISHLDLARLFKRCLKRAGVELSYSEGYNPHEKINIVQPLSLGFETTGDYFEIETVRPFDPESLKADLNAIFPPGLSFLSCEEFPKENRNLSARCEYASYDVHIPLLKAENLPVGEFLAQSEVVISKRDKKSKTTVKKNVKDMIYSAGVKEGAEGRYLELVIRCASNQTLNPLNLTEALLEFAGTPYRKEDIRITRTGLYYTEDGALVPLSILPKAVRDALDAAGPGE